MVQSLLGLLLVGKDDSVRSHSAVEQPSVCCLTSSRQLDAFLRICKHLSDTLPPEFCDTHKLGLVWWRKKDKSKIPACCLTSSRQLDAFLAPEWDVCFWIVWYFLWDENLNSIIPARCLNYIIKAAWHFLGGVQALKRDVCFWLWWYPGIRCLVWREKIQKKNMNLLLYLTKAARRFLRLCRDLSEVFCFESDDSGW